MTGYLVPISKAKKDSQKDTQQRVKTKLDEAARKAKAVIVPDPPAASPPPPGTPANKMSPRLMRWTSPKVLVGGSAALAAGGTGAYLYRRKRVEKSLSSMQRDLASVMMSPT
jgi:hypothetical protein